MIVGAGSAGCVLANRLSEDPSVRVLLLEAGGRDRSPNIKIPAAFAKQFHTKLDWDYATEPEPHVDGRSLYIPRGKGLGGSSSMNAMLYVRGRPLDYDAWEAQGAPGWGYRDVLPYFIKLRGQRRAAPRSATAPAVRCASPSSARRAPLDRRLLAASEAAGHPAHRRLQRARAGRRRRCSRSRRRDGQRFSAADAYLRPALDAAQPRGAHEASPCWDRARGRARRRRARAPGPQRRARWCAPSARCCSSAGAIGSPQLLLLSGIGAAEELRAAGVRGRATSCPGVGRNLQDHPFVTMIWEVSDQDTLYGADKPQAAGRVAAAPTRAAHLDRRRGRRLHRTRGGLPAADIQFHMGAAYFDDHGAETYDGHCMVIAPCSSRRRRAAGCGCARPIRPTSRGIITNTLSEPEDLASLVAGMRLAREIAAQPAAAPRSSSRSSSPAPSARTTTRSWKPTCAGG